MGCDIHFYVEKPTADGWEYVAPPAGLDQFSEQYGCTPRFFHDRDYVVFSWLAGVRNDGSIEPIAEPRGMPDGVSKFVHEENTLRIVPEDDEDEEGTCTADQARRWGCEIVDGRATHPDWHSHSWLTVRELLAAFEERTDQPFRHFKKTVTEIVAHAGLDARVVFWFDC
jgi:hypothetical protein